MDVTNLPLYSIDEANKLADRIYKTQIPGLFYINTQVHTDDRGFYREVALIPDLDTVRKEKFEVKQLNHSTSNTNVARGIHSESWNKLVTVTHGVCLCVLSDIRPDSPTFLKKEYILLGFGENNPLPGAIFITQGIGNSFLTLEGPSDYIYAVDSLYRERDTSGDTAVSLFDEDLAIAWPVAKEDMLMSDRDKASVTLRTLYPEKF